MLEFDGRERKVEKVGRRVVDESEFGDGNPVDESINAGLSDFLQIKPKDSRVYPVLVSYTLYCNFILFSF